VVKARWKLIAVSFLGLCCSLGEDGGCFLKSFILSIFKISYSS